MSSRRHVSTGSPYEPIIGLSRAVRIGDTIAVAGTAPLDANGKTAAPRAAPRRAQRRE